jgi:hypothetical protein
LPLKTVITPTIIFNNKGYFICTVKELHPQLLPLHHQFNFNGGGTVPGPGTKFK